jgi:hypothetical protein
VLLHGDEVARPLVRYGVGVRTERTLDIKRIDYDFFDTREICEPWPSRYVIWKYEAGSRSIVATRTASYQPVRTRYCGNLPCAAVAEKRKQAIARPSRAASNGKQRARLVQSEPMRHFGPGVCPFTE